MCKTIIAKSRGRHKLAPVDVHTQFEFLEKYLQPELKLSG